MLIFTPLLLSLLIIGSTKLQQQGMRKDASSILVKTTFSLIYFLSAA
jgi:hypothetical protein